MRLELRQISGPPENGATQRWSFERGRRTLGRSNDCDWQIADVSRSVSKLHCTIEQDREGYLLRDESANGSKVDGVTILEGETARLSDKSRIECGNFTFSVAISGEKDLDIDDPDADLRLSDEHMTISSILSDVSSGGRTATGIMGSRSEGEWPEQVRTPRRGADAAPSSRNVEIGWSGPPETDLMKPLLPNDWDADFDYGNQLEHSVATHVSIPVAKSKKAKPAPDVKPEKSKSDVVEQVVPVPVAPQGRDILPRLEALLGQIEEASATPFSAFEIDVDAFADTTEPFGLSREETVEARLRAVLSRQMQLNTAIEGVLKHATRTMEPRLIEAQVDAQPRKLPWRSDRSYWQAYREQFEDEGRNLSIREVFRKAMLNALGADDDQGADNDTQKANRAE
jgi:type VI secretion system protein ImpI